MTAKPLAGIRVLTFEQFGAGPYGTMFLAELGAEVVKVEPPEGDPSRRVGPHFLGEADSEYFQAWNLGKRSVVLDLKTPAGRRGFERLVEGAEPSPMGADAFAAFLRADIERWRKLAASAGIRAD